MVIGYSKLDPGLVEHPCAALLFEVPMKLPSVANIREGHWAKARRTKQQRMLVALHAGEAIDRGSFHVPTRAEFTKAVVTLTRVSPRELDSDNNVSAFKAVRDQVAAVIGLDDRSDQIEWHYYQAKFGKEHAVRIQIDWYQEVT
jgi:hypothetical protein